MVWRRKKWAASKNGQTGYQRQRSGGELATLQLMEGGPRNPMGARGLYLYQGNKDTLFRIHGTNQPEHIGMARIVRLHSYDE